MSAYEASSAGMLHAIHIREIRILKDLELSIQMDVNRRDGSKEEDTHSSTSFVSSKVVVVEEPVVDALTGSTLLVSVLEELRLPGNRREEAKVAARLHVNTATVLGRRAVGDTGTGTGGLTCSSKRATVLEPVVLVIHALVDHALPTMADGNTIVVIGDGVLDGLLLPTAVEANERIDVPGVHAEAVGRHVVVSGVEADVLYAVVWVRRKELVKADQAGSGVVTTGRKYTDVHGQIDMVIRVVRREGIDGVPEVILLKITVISPGGVCIREVAGTGTVVDTTLMAVTAMVTMGTGMNVEARSIAGNRVNSSEQTSLLRALDAKNAEESLVNAAKGIGESLAGSDDALAFFRNTGIGIRELAI